MNALPLTLWALAAQALAAAITDLRLSTPVASIKDDDDGVRVNTTSGLLAHCFLFPR